MTGEVASGTAAEWAPIDTESLGLPRDIISLAREALGEGADTAALHLRGRSGGTRERFRSAVEQFAGYLSSRVEKGDRVLIMLDNRTEFMVAWLAVNACGASLVSINTSAREHDAGHIVRDSAARIAICGPDHAELIERIAGDEEIEVVVVSGEEPDGLASYASDSGPLPLDQIEVDPEAITNVYYTSGTTGPPKGCMVGHDYWIRFVELYLGMYGLDRDDRLLCCLQFFYNDPPWLFLTSLHAGVPLVAMRRFSVSRFWPIVVEHEVTQALRPRRDSRAPAEGREPTRGTPAQGRVRSACRHPRSAPRRVRGALGLSLGGGVRVDRVRPGRGDAA